MTNRNPQADPGSALPLFRFFNLLQHNGFAIGVDDYFALLSALVWGNALSDQNKLFRTCKLLWLKDQEQEPLFRSLFGKAWEQEREDIVARQAARIRTQAKNKSKSLKEDEKAIHQTQSKGTPTPKTEQEVQSEQPPKEATPTPSEEPAPQPVYGSVRISIEPSSSPANLSVVQKTSETQQNYLVSGSWLNVKDRDLIQRFRHLRQMESYGHEMTINIPATVLKISNEGWFLEPVWEKARKNMTRLLVLVDHEGSMVAFGELADMIAQDAIISQSAGNNIFYFNNLPEEYLWRNKAHTDAIPARRIQEMLKQPNTWLLIISDAGAARGRYDISRVDATARWLSSVSSGSRSIAWINPVPFKRWMGTSAAAISRQVTMFEATPHGVQNVVRFLKGSSFKNNLI